MPEKETRGNALAKMVDELLPKGDFKKALVIVIKHVLGYEKKLMDKLGEISNALSTTHANAMARMEVTLNARFDGLLQGKDGRDGVDGRDGKDGRPGVPGKNGAPDTGVEIIEKINKDKSDKKIRKEKVEGLKEIEDMARSAEATSRTFGAGGNFVYVADLSSQTNGVTKTFTVPSHSRSIMVMGSDFPTVLFSGNGYTESSATTILLTTDNAPSTGSQLGYMYVLI